MKRSFNIYLVVSYLIFLTSCTLCLQNIATDGTASDVADDSQAADPKFDIPLKPM
jgi:hypothetical protein